MLISGCGCCLLRHDRYSWFCQRFEEIDLEKEVRSGVLRCEQNQLCHSGAPTRGNSTTCAPPHSLKDEGPEAQLAARRRRIDHDVNRAMKQVDGPRKPGITLARPKNSDIDMV
jgi:hypothetical protein